MDGDKILKRRAWKLAFALALSLGWGGSCGRTPQFDAQRAFQDLKKQCSFGPRAPAAEGHSKAGQYIYRALKETADECWFQRFSYYDSLTGRQLSLFNIVASYYPDSKERIMLCAHWDTRPRSEMDPDSTKRHLPILGANDGASGVAVLLEIGRLLKRHKPPVGVDIVLFDGEDYGLQGEKEGWFLGSKHFARNLGLYRPQVAILLDMVGDAELRVYRERISEAYAKDLNDYIWGVAAESGSQVFIDSVKHAVLDDHVPLLRAGLKAVDIIDFDYPYWHTQEDTPDKCSPEALGQVGRVLLAAIMSEKIRTLWAQQPSSLSVY